MSVSPKVKRYTLLLVTSLLVLIAAGRILRLNLDHKELHIDEIWSVWQLLGNHTDYSRDATWPPLYYVVLDGWRQLVGIDPFALRYLSVLMFMVSAAVTYRAMRRLSSESAAMLAMLAYSALALGIFVTIQVRAYGLVYSLMPLAFWLTIRYFDQPKIRRGILLALVMVAMFYTAYGSVGAFLMLGIYTLLVYRQAIWRWWLPGVIAGALAFPGVAHVWNLTVTRLAPLAIQPMQPFLPALANFYNRDTGYNTIVWIVLALVAAAMLIIYQRPLRMKALAFLLWGFGAVLLYVLNRYLGLFDSVYGWFLVLGAVFWIAWGLSYLPRIARLGATALLIIVMLTPISYATFEAEPPPMGQSFEALAKTVQWGDVIVLDPLWKDRLCDCLNPEEFEYLTKLYFPQGLPVVTSPEGYQRVWYLKWDSLEDKTFQKRVQQGRVAGKFIGPPEALFQLYETPPNPVGILFDNGLRFHGIELMDAPPGLFVHRVLDTVRVRLWWSVDKPLTADYSISLRVFYKNQLAIQSDSGPQLIDPALPKATSQWQPGQFYIEEREFSIPRVFTTGQYPLLLTVYQWWDNTRINAPGVNQDSLLPIQTLYIKAW
jgi:MFS family permease